MMNARSRCSFLAVPVLLTLACSAPVPLPAQGAVTLSITKASSTCPDSGTTYSVGAPNAPSNSSFGNSVISGQSNSEISCSVRGSATGFTFSGSLYAFTQTPVFPITVTFSNGVIDRSTMTGTASVTVKTPNLASTYSSTEPCTIKVIQGAIKGGSIWASFTCPSVTTTPSGTCGVGQSVIVFENCDGA